MSIHHRSGRGFLSAASAAVLFAAILFETAPTALPAPPDQAQAKPIDLSKLPAAAEYGTEPPKGPGFLGSEAAVLGRSLTRINKALGTSLREDNRLARMARWIYDRFGPEPAFPSQSELDLLTQHLGLPEPLPHLLMTYAHDAPRLAHVVSARLARVFDLAEYTHIGGVAERVEAGVIVVIALSRRHLTMAPVPRTLPGPFRLPLEGTLTPGYSRPTLAHTLPNGETRMEPLGQGPAFKASVDLAAPGRHRLEVVATGRAGPNVIANFPVYVGVPAASTVEPAATAGRPPKPDDALSRLFDLINEARAEAGLDALVLDPELSAVALGHCEDMRKSGFVGHISPSTGGPEERLLKAGIVSDVAAENVARGGLPDEIHKGLMDSPGHRAAILNRSVTHVGIGVASERKEGLTDYLVTELFIRRIPPLGGEAMLLVLAELAASRELDGLPALKEDPALSGLAGEAAREFLEDHALTQGEVMDRLRQRLGRGQAAGGSVTAAFIVSGSIKEGVDRMEIDPKAWARARKVGAGVAQGVRPGLVPNSIVLILIFAE